MSEVESQAPSGGDKPPDQSKPAGNGKAGNGKAGNNRRRRIRLVLGILVLAAAVGGVPYYLHARQYESTDDAAVEGQVIAVSPRINGQVITVAINDNQDVREGDVLFEIDPADYQARADQAKGAMDAAAARLGAAKVNVVVTEITAKAELDVAIAGVEIAQAALGSAQAQVQSAESLLERSKATVNSARASRDQAKAEAVAADADANYARRDLERYRQLLDRGQATAHEIDVAQALEQSNTAKLQAAREKTAAAEATVAEDEADVKVADNGVTQAQAQLKQAESSILEAQARRAQADVTAQRLAVAAAQRDEAAADYEQLKAAYDLAALELSYTTVTAARAGRVTKKSVEPGMYVQAGEPLLALVTPDMWVVANFKETQLTRMAPGQPVTISVDAYPSLELHGHVDSLQAGTGGRFSLLPAENATGNFVKVVQRVPVKIVFDRMPDPAHLIGPGMSVVPEVKVR